MQYKFRLVYFSLFAFFTLAACNSEAINNVSKTTTDTQQETQLAETGVTEDSTSVEEEPEETEETEDQSSLEIAEESEEIKEKEVAIEESVTNESGSETTEALDPEFQLAIEQLLATSDSNLEDYIFLYTQTDNYIEIDVREAIDEETTVAVNLYRYNLETNELLVNDYLTGEFIPVESIQ